MKVRKNKPELFICSLLPALSLLIFLATGSEPQVFTTNTGSRYHRETCSSLRVSTIKISLKEAIRRDLKPCGICNPLTLASETSAAPDAADNRSIQSGGAPKTISSTGAHSVEPYRVNQQRLKTSGAADLSLMSRAKVTGHVDGDTVKVRIYNPPAGINELETVRMLGVDAPETKHPSKPMEYFGKEASEFTRKALLNKQVFLAFDFDLRDRYGRLLAYIYTSREQCFNAKLIYEGYAHAYIYFPFQFMDEFRRLEREARKAKRGLWANPNIS